MSLAKRFLTGASWNVVERLAGFGLSMFLSVVITRGLGVENYGIYATLMSIVLVAESLAAFGIEWVIMTHLPQVAASDEAKASFLLRGLLLTRGLVYLVVSLILLVFAPWIATYQNRPEVSAYLWLMIPFFVFTGLGKLLRTVLVAHLEVKPAAIVQTTLQALTLVLAFFLLFRADWGLYGMILATTVSAALSFACYLFLARGHLQGGVTPLSLRPFYRFGVVVWLIGLASLALGGNVQIILLNRFGLAAADVGFYKLAVGLGANVGLLTVGLGGLSQATFSEASVKGGSAAIGKAWSSIIKLVTLLEIPITFFLFFNTGAVVKILYTEEYLPVASLLRLILLLGTVGTLIGSGYSYQVFYTLGLEKIRLATRWGAGVLGLIFSILAIPRLGASGAIIATGAAGVSITLLEMILVARLTKSFLPLAFQAKVVAAFALALLPTLLVPSGGVAFLAAKGLIYVVTSAFILTFLKPLAEEEKQLVARLDRRIYMAARFF